MRAARQIAQQGRFDAFLTGATHGELNGVFGGS